MRKRKILFMEEKAINIVTTFRCEKAGKCLSIVIKNFFIALDKCLLSTNELEKRSGEDEKGV